MWLLGRSISDHKTIADTVRVAVALPNGELLSRREVYQVSNADQAIPLAMPARYTSRRATDGSVVDTEDRKFDVQLEAGLAGKQWKQQAAGWPRPRTAAPWKKRLASEDAGGLAEKCRTAARRNKGAFRALAMCLPFSLDKDFPAPNL
jgi:hypothetical protein